MILMFIISPFREGSALATESLVSRETAWRSFESLMQVTHVGILIGGQVLIIDRIKQTIKSGYECVPLIT